MKKQDPGGAGSDGVAERVCNMLFLSGRHLVGVMPAEFLLSNGGA